MSNDMANQDPGGDKREKRPEVARYKPGAFKQQEPEELLPGLRERFDQRAHGGGGYRGGGANYHGDAGYHGGGGFRSGGSRGTANRRNRGHNRGGGGQKYDGYGQQKNDEGGKPRNNEDANKTLEKSNKRKENKNSSDIKDDERPKKPDKSKDTKKPAEDTGTITRDDERKKRPEKAHYVAKKPGEVENYQEHVEHNQQQYETGTKTRKKKNKNKPKDNKVDSNASKNEGPEKVDRKDKEEYEKKHKLDSEEKVQDSKSTRRDGKGTKGDSKDNRDMRGDRKDARNQREENKEVRDDRRHAKHKKTEKENETPRNQQSQKKEHLPEKSNRDARDDITFRKPPAAETSRYGSGGGRSGGQGGGGARSQRGRHGGDHRNSMHQDSWDDRRSETHQEYSTKSLPWRRGGGGSGGGGRGSRRSSPSSRSGGGGRGSRRSSPSSRSGGGGRGSRRSSPSSRSGWWRDSSSRQSSPRRWTSRPGSRASSPRSSRGNSPYRSKPHSRRSSFDRRSSGPQFEYRSGPFGNQQGYGSRRGKEKSSSRPTLLRTPSPVDHRNKRDSRDLDGWTRNDTRRRQDFVGSQGPASFQETKPAPVQYSESSKPPTGRVKSAPVSNLHQRNVATKDEEARVPRKESETMYSDWSQEIEEEEDRSLSIDPPSFRSDTRSDMSPFSRSEATPPFGRSTELTLPFGRADSSYGRQEPFTPIGFESTGRTEPMSLPVGGTPVDRSPLDAGPSGRGVLRLVPETSTPSPSSLSAHSWASNETRGAPPSPMLPPSADQQRYLFNPNNPSKPILMEGEPSRRDRPGLPFQSPPGVSYRFPVNLPRFGTSPNMMPPVISAPVSGFNQPLQRPPVAGIQGPDWYDVFNQNIYGAGKVDINVIVRIIHADKKLKQIMQGGADIVSSRWTYEVREARHEIMNAGWNLLKNDLYFVCNKDIDGHIWKTVYHEVLELLREAYLNPDNDDPETKHNLKTCLLSLFDEGVDYYNQLLKDVSEIYHVNLNRFYDVLEPRDLRKLGKLALIVAQKVLLYLGDLSRYREQINGTTNYGRARQYYLKANHLDMRNGRPFNMLAILAKMCNRKFEAVYYHIRCLTCSNAIPASKEGLGVLFYEMKMRWEAGEKARLDKKAEEEKRTEDVASSCLIKGSRVRREIWIRHEDGKRLHRTTSANTGTSESSSLHDYSTLSTADLNKRFINTYLHVQGMFFTQINTEHIGQATESLLHQFRALVNKSPLPVSAERLVQIMALNMYSIEKTKMKSEGAESPAYRSVMQTKALELSGDMFAILLERCNILIAASNLDDLLESRSNRSLEDLTPLLAAVKVWCDWLMGNNDTWCPVVSAEPFTQLAQLATRLEPLKNQVAEILGQCLTDEAWTALPQSRRADYEIIRLTEDAVLCEYEYWFRGLEWSTYRQFCPKSGDLMAAEVAKRVDQIRMCVEFMEGLDPPVLKWSAPDNSHVCLVTDRDEDTEASVARDMAEANLTALIARDEDILEESYSEDEKDKVDGEDDQLHEVTDEVARLRLRKVELERLQTQEARKAQREILNQHVRTTLEIRPKYLVPDTNEFIDNLPAIKELAGLGDIQICVSVVVLGELEGLSKSREMVDRPEHAAMLRENSKAALAWIRDRPPNLKCVTTKGNILTSLKVTAELDSTADLTNDDKILKCCLVLDTSPPTLTKDGMKTVYRNSVLLTDDRNLKLKAHIQDCAVSKINHFIEWYTSKPAEN